MKLLFCLSLTTAILSGLWAWVADLLGLIGWAGFLGCTAYFAYPKDGIKGLGITALTVSSGVVWGLVILHSDSYLQNLPSFIGYFVTGFVAFFMCIQAKKQWLSYIPGTFVGTCTIFAAQGAWLITIQSLLIGIVFGFSMKKSGMWLAEK
ncbi:MULTISPECIES: DUF1097 domain-containing protein [Providencia]|uniref:DUF1097 domain-containing protein n=1 Tax=Providencia TaxID=586 RepID=UPI00197D92DE|nr:MULTISPECIES: DUF1097 domain-containing protein [Providencia]MBN4865409.1 DUF1097 domain-containing protein [Providencia stuartii]MBN4874366.1 DUF1097 domain-containing protein [Providencia stuartii]MBN4879422.1 DUF1097 domain-containing protein [Providencia stuartii]MBN4883567.1 DUF1097 domain-containing protein [Providencia stuartii]